MNDREWTQEVKALKSRIEELEKELEKVESEGEKKYPANGTLVYYLNGDGLVTWECWGHWSEETEKRMKLKFDSGKIFLTRADAEEFAEVQCIEDELYALADDDKEWDKQNRHYFLHYSYDSSSCQISYVYSRQENVPYFASEESAKAAVEAVGEERVAKWLTYKRTRGNNK